MYSFIFTLDSDSGKIEMSVVAANITLAINTVLDLEKCPETAITSIRRLKFKNKKS